MQTLLHKRSVQQNTDAAKQQHHTNRIILRIQSTNEYTSHAHIWLPNLRAQQRAISKWSERARMGIFLGQSPQHATTISFVLCLSTGLTSPQFHMQYDNGFETMRESSGCNPSVALWQYKCGFTDKGTRERNR